MNKELEKIIETVKSLQDKIRDRYKAKVLGIFGSYTRGEQKSGSDVDVLVEFQSEADLIHFVGVSLFLEEELGLNVDIVPYDTIGPEIKETILREVVYL